MLSIMFTGAFQYMSFGEDRWVLLIGINLGVELVDYQVWRSSALVNVAKDFITNVWELQLFHILPNIVLFLFNFSSSSWF